MAKYRLTKTDATVDGTEFIKFDLFGLSDEAVALRHAEFLVPVATVQAALASGNVGAALVQALRDNVPDAGWTNVELDEQAVEKSAFDARNENAQAVDEALDAFIVSIGGYPREFNA